MLKRARPIAMAVSMAFVATAATATNPQQQHQSTKTQAQSAQVQQGAQSWNTAELRNGYSAQRLLDMDVRGARGEQIGSVENILVKDNRVTAVVIETQGFLDMFDTHFRIPWQQVEFGPGMDHIKVPLTEESIDRYAELKPERVATGQREWRVTEFIGDYATLRDGRHYGMVNDLIISRDGNVKATVFTPTRAFGGGYYAYPWRAAAFDPGVNTFPLPYDRDHVARWSQFDYTAHGIERPQRMAKRSSLVDRAALRQGLSVERLLGTDVRGTNGNSIGEIDNILVNAKGEITAIVIDSGGILNIGETHHRVPWQQVTIGSEMDHVKVPMAEDNMDQFNLFSEGVRTGPREWRVTELIDDYASLKDGAQYGVVQDVIANRDGKIQAVVVSSRSSFGGGQHAFPFRADGFTPGGDSYQLEYGRDQVSGLPMFRYDAYAITAPIGTMSASPQVRAVGATR